MSRQNKEDLIELYSKLAPIGLAGDGSSCHGERDLLGVSISTTAVKASAALPWHCRIPRSLEVE